jgi:hypothetical protein
VLLVPIGTANAGEGGDPFDVPAVSAYVEDIPSASGSVPSASGRRTTVQRRAKVRSLPRKAEARIEQAGELAPKLREVATSSRYGAPTPKPEREGVAPLVLGEREGKNVETPDALDATVTAAATGSAELRILIVVLFATTLGAAGLAAARARGR